ncbi:PTS sugar transporter subunit IIB [Anaerosalibacter massiliensis]|uniref:PTS sugar transporter subunit IIB n=1 Tax=Anaerosalibacter massiliensis TaxID=1347392 RepID=A0A9X2MI49_9FIRM|nr:PTS sugar transporter subunit IIB [Anaerosalibacter massiliensis]MCR2044478.1 PTS sugar transporter subunit IIB [Anaerosalibacter massiliensis]
MKKHILVACGAGIATSTVVTERITNLLKDNNIDFEITQCKIAEVSSLANSADLIVSTTILPTKYDIPSLNAISYITGAGEKKLDRQIIDMLSK